MGELNDINVETVFAGLLGLAFLFMIAFIWIIVLSVKLRAMRKRYKATMQGTSGADLEQVMLNIQNQMKEVRLGYEEQAITFEQMSTAQRSMFNRLAVMRYNAFQERGSDLSFSIAILNEMADGIVLTGIHSREQTYVYAKPVEKGESTYALTPEEKETIIQALQKK